jgi:hypothetical protein
MFGRSRLRLTRLLGVVAAVLACAVLPSAAQAASAPPCQVHGTILEGDITAESVSFHGNTAIGVFTHPIFFDGNLSGVGIAKERDVVHLQNDAIDVHARVAFTGSVTCADGRVLGAGGLVLNFNAIADFPTSFTAHFQVIGSSGGLAGTQGSGTVSGVPGVPGGNGPYDGTLR